ncbi:hypothetical protein [Rugosimonospora africana]|nr:hypothetical protein [Rugosimonospora africana]
MDEGGDEHVDVTREVVVDDRTIRVRASYRYGGDVTVDLAIEDGEGERCGILTGTLAATDLLSASKALTSLFGAVASVLGQTNAGKAVEFEEVRRRYPNAYKPWTTAEEARLIERYRTQPNVAALAREFGRRPGGIAHRLEHLNLRPMPDRQPEPDAGYDDEEPDWG